MRRTELLNRAEDLRRARKPYVLATVVRAIRPTSAKAGDCALVLADGTLDGFVGGTCAESTVRLQGLRLLESGASTLLRINPDAGPDDADEEGLVVVNNPCLSGGSLEIFLEAMIPEPLIYVYGDAPVARALGRVGAAAGYDMASASDIGAGPVDIPPDTAAVVVASHGHDEEVILAAALRAEVPYVALVASRTRGEAVLANIDADRDRIHTPAGLDIGARTAPDVAVSILAEIISVRPRRAVPPPPVPVAPAALAVDPVCHMEVAVTPTALSAEHAGTSYYFCGSGCKAAFVADPGKYLGAHA